MSFFFGPYTLRRIFLSRIAIFSPSILAVGHDSDTRGELLLVTDSHKVIFDLRENPFDLLYYNNIVIILVAVVCPRPFPAIIARHF